MHRALVPAALLFAACSGAANSSPDSGVTLAADTGLAPGADAGPAAGPDAATIVSSRAYKGHENDVDTNNFVNAYPPTVGTRLDDCQTCHKSGTFTDSTTSKKIAKNACDFCHLIRYPMTGVAEAMPASYAETLNPYGADYKAGGRTKAALLAVDTKDSDGDTFANGVEIADLKYPGDPTSKPGQPNAPQKIFSMADLKALAAHSEFLLSNSNKQQYDFYATYKGVTLKALLTAAGVSPTDPNVTGVTIIAPDGYMIDVTIGAINQLYPKAQFWAGLDTASLGATCGFVQYPANIPAGLVDGGEVPDEQWLMMAYERDGALMDTSNLDQTSGKISGEGPYRLIVPQAVPGKPDRGSQYSPTSCNDGHDYDSSADHNAGSMVRGVVAMRINPLPAGVEDFDAKNGGWAFVANSTLMVYGYGITK